MAFTLDGESLDWRTTYTIDDAVIDATLTNKDCYINLADFGADFWDNVKSDGGDIRASLADGTTRIPVELKSFNDGTETGQLWIKASSISSSANTVLYVFWGNGALSQPAADSTYGSENVWDANYILVAHLEESGDGTADEYKDSTSNDNHGQGGGGTPEKAPSRVTGFLDFGQQFFPFSANPDHINFGNDSSLDMAGAITLEVLVNHTSFGSVHGGGVYMIKSTANGSGAIPFEFRTVKTTGVTRFSINGSHSLSTTSLSTSTDYHIAATYDGTTSGTNKYIYINGTEDSSFTQTSNMPSNGAVNLTVGTMDNSTNFNRIDAVMDEIRISDTDRSAAWIKATHSNLLDRGNFYTLGTPEEDVGEVFISRIKIS